MPSWQATAVFCFAFAATMYFKFIVPEADHEDPIPDEMGSRIARLKRYRMEHGTCVHCGEPLPHARIAGTLTAPVCPYCGPASCN